MNKKEISNISAVVLLHVFLVFVFGNAFKWYWMNVTKNPYYNFSLIFIALWLFLYYLLKFYRPAVKNYLPILLVLLPISWTMYLIFRGPFFAMLCFMITSLIPVWRFWRRIANYLDNLYIAILFTLPLPFYVEILSMLQIFSMKISITVLKILGIALKTQGALIYLPSGDLKIASACSGFQSIVVLLALSAMASFFLNFNIFGKAILIFSSTILAVLFNIFRISSILLIGFFKNVSVAAALWHGSSAWIFYILVLITLGAETLWLRKYFLNSKQQP